MHMKLYNKLKVKSEAFNYQEYQKKEIQKKIEASTTSRLKVSSGESAVKSKKVAVNQQLHEEMVEKSRKNTKEIDPFFTLVEDDRFKDMFKNTDFAVDKDNEAYIRSHPSEKGKNVKARRQTNQDENEEAAATEEEQSATAKYQAKQKKILEKAKKTDKLEKVKLIKKNKEIKETFEKKLEKGRKSSGNSLNAPRFR